MSGLCDLISLYQRDKFLYVILRVMSKTCTRGKEKTNDAKHVSTKSANKKPDKVKLVFIGNLIYEVHKRSNILVKPAYAIVTTSGSPIIKWSGLCMEVKIILQS